MEGVVSKILPPLKNNYVATSTAKVVTEENVCLHQNRWQLKKISNEPTI